MRASEFEYHHQTLVHLLIVGASFLTYLLDRNDLVWTLVRGRSDQYVLERLFFAAATVLIGLGAGLRTWAGVYLEAPGTVTTPLPGPDGQYEYIPYPGQLGGLIFSVGLGFLAPVSGFLLLVVGETLVAVRLIRRERELGEATEFSEGTARRGPGPFSKARSALRGQPSWGGAFRRESAKWGLFLTMIVFTLLLRDRVAEVLAGVSFLVWVVLNCAAPAGSASRS